MHTHILIPTDGSELSGKTVEYGVALARSVGARVTGLTVSPPVPRPMSRSEEAAGRLAQITEAAARAGIDCDVVHAQDRHPYKSIIEIANRKGCDLIVMASHGRRGLSALLMGSETVKVLTHSSVPVLVVRRQGSALVPDFFAAS